MQKVCETGDDSIFADGGGRGGWRSRDKYQITSVLSIDYISVQKYLLTKAICSCRKRDTSSADSKLNPCI